jgi:hypothetical protein
METIRQSYEHLPETLTIQIPKEMVNKKGEVHIFSTLAESNKIGNLADFFGILPDFPDRYPQGDYEKREPF